jgi:squalene-hopene/tetraprenyl-beta-curcumene cyclase
VCARCGWSYLTDLAEEPADADTLAQVLQLAIRAGGAERAAFDAPIHLALSAGGHPDGSFETWILPPVPEREPLHDRQAQLVARAWGDGPDPEVMANLLYALALWAPARFAGPIERGARFLLARQRDTGAWGASWYWGPFYSTYAHVRLLARVASPEATAAVARAAAALLEGQGPRGDWSYRDVPRALDTAHAILALLAAEPVVPALQRPLRDAITRGLAALRSAQLPDGTWPADDFIRMDCGRAQRAAGRELAFGSRTLTAAYVLKAAATARRALGAVA